MRAVKPGYTILLIILLAGVVAVSWFMLLRPPLPAASVSPAPVADAGDRPAPRPSVTQMVGLLDVARMQGHVEKLTGEIGARQAGTASEQAAAEYVRQQLEESGYQVTLTPVPLPNGKQSVNVSAELPGEVEQAILIGAHIDSFAPSPGANDNASGVAVMLELARVLRASPPHYSIIFAGFGAEERQGRNRDHHHFGSRLMAADDTLRRRLAGMASLDMVGYGTQLHITNQGWAADHWRDRIGAVARDMGLPARAQRGRPWSDHEAFEKRGIPAAYLHWERDPHYHRRTDTPAHIQPERLRQTAELMLRVLLNSKGVGE